MNRLNHKRELLVAVVCFSFGQMVFGQLAPDFSTREPPPRAVDDSLLTQSFTLAAHHTAVAAVAFAPDGKTLASISNDGTLKLWDLDKQSQCGSIAGFPTNGRGYLDRDVCFSPDGKLLGAATSGKSIQMIDVATTKVRWSHDEGARSIAFSRDGKSIVATDWKSSWVKIWDADTGESIAKLRGNPADVEGAESPQGSVAFSPCGKTFATAIGGGRRIQPRMTVWDSESQEPVYEFDAATYQVNVLDYSPDSQLLAAGTEHGQLNVYAVVHEIKKVDEAQVAKLIVQLDDDEFAIRESAQKQLLDYGDAILDQLRAASAKTQSIEVRFRMSAVMKMISIHKSVPRAILNMREAVVAVEFSPNGQYLAAGSCGSRTSSSEITIWSTSNFTRPIFYQSGKGIHSLTFSPDGQRLASAFRDGTISVWQFKDAAKP